MAPDDLQARLEAMEQRLGELEQRFARPLPPPASGEAPDFWALQELQRRSPGMGQVLYAGVATLPNGETYLWQADGEVEHLLEQDWTASADVIGALGHPVRLTLMRHILQGRRTVAELQEVESLGTTGQLYHHLRQLVAAGWLRADGRGRYAVPVEKVVPLLVVIRVAEAG